MVDAADSKSATCEGVGVQVPSSVFSLLKPVHNQAETPHGANSIFVAQRPRCSGRARGHRHVQVVRRVLTLDDTQV